MLWGSKQQGWVMCIGGGVVSSVVGSKQQGWVMCIGGGVVSSVVG